MITIEQSQRIRKLARELNTAAAELLASTQPRTAHAGSEPPTHPHVSQGICRACAKLLENGGGRN